MGNRFNETLFVGHFDQTEQLAVLFLVKVNAFLYHFLVFDAFLSSYTCVVTRLALALKLGEMKVFISTFCGIRKCYFRYVPMSFSCLVIVIS